MLDWSLIAGIVPILVECVGLVGLAVLLRGTGRRWWTRVAPVLLIGAVAGACTVGWVVDSVWKPFPDPLPPRVLAWIGVALAVIAVASSRGLRRPRGGALLLAVLAGLTALLVPAMKVNAVYAYYPTVRDVLGIGDVAHVDFADLPPPRVTEAPSAVRPVSELWRQPPDLPSSGVVTTVDIPGTVSGFPARPASIYLPPAYLSAQRPVLPVLVLIAGQPGAPQDWLSAGKVAVAMDHFARAHAGLAPIVVLPDATGSAFGNPLCLDSRLGMAETYLARDVPNWVSQHLQADPDRGHWVIGGFSYGGTCALQLAIRAPQTYRTFLDISGQSEPTLGTRSATVQAAYGGDQARFRAVNPLDVMAATRYPDTVAVFAVGDHDGEYGPQADLVSRAAIRAGMRVTALRVAGTHSWAVATAALRQALPALAERMRLIPPP